MADKPTYEQGQLQLQFMICDARPSYGKPATGSHKTISWRALKTASASPRSVRKRVLT